MARTKCGGCCRGRRQISMGLIKSFSIPSLRPTKNCNDKCNDAKEVHDKVIKNVLCNLVLLRKIMSAGKPADITYKINKLPNDVEWYLHNGYITILKEKLEREDKELKQLAQEQQIIINDDNSNESSSSSSSASTKPLSFIVKKDYSLGHLQWNFQTASIICTLDEKSKEELDLFYYLYNKRPEWFCNQSCLKSAAGRGNIEIFKHVLNNAIFPISCDMNECIVEALRNLKSEMASYLLKANGNKLTVTLPFNVHITPLNRLDFIKVAKVLIDHVKSSRGKQISTFITRLFTYVLDCHDIEFARYAKGHYDFVPHEVTTWFQGLLDSGPYEELDVEQHIEFIKQMFQLHVNPARCKELFDNAIKEVDRFVGPLVDDENELLRVKETQLHDDEESDEDDSDTLFFEKVKLLSTKYSRWYMFIYHLYQNRQGAPERDHERFSPLFKVRVKEELKEDFIRMVVKLHGWDFLVSVGTLEYIQIAHKLGLVDSSTVLFEGNEDQSLEIVKYLHEHGVGKFDVRTVQNCCYRQCHDTLLFLYQHYPHLFTQEISNSLLHYISASKQYSLLNMIPIPNQPRQYPYPIPPQQFQQEFLQQQHPSSLTPTSPLPIYRSYVTVNGGGLKMEEMKILSKLTFLTYYYSEKDGDESFQLMQEYYESNSNPNLQSIYTSQLCMSTTANQINVVDYLLNQQSRFQPNLFTLTKILSIAFEHGHRDMYKLIKKKMVSTNNDSNNNSTPQSPTKRYDVDVSTWTKPGSRGNIKLLDKFATKYHNVDFNSCIRAAITHNQTEFLQHIFKNYPTKVFPMNLNIGVAVRQSQPVILQMLLDHVISSKDATILGDDAFPKPATIKEYLLLALKESIQTSNLHCFKLVVDYYDLYGREKGDEGKSLPKSIIQHFTYHHANNLPLLCYLIHHGYVTSPRQIQKGPDYLKLLFEKKRKEVPEESEISTSTPSAPSTSKTKKAPGRPTKKVKK